MQNTTCDDNIYLGFKWKKTVMKILKQFFKAPNAHSTKVRIEDCLQLNNSLLFDGTRSLNSLRQYQKPQKGEIKSGHIEYSVPTR